MKDCKHYREGYYSDNIGYEEKDKINACGLTQTGYHEMSYEKCSDITNCYYKQLLAEQTKTKKLVEALESVNKKFPINDKYIFKNDTENICRILFNIRDIIQQALNEVNNAK